MKADSKIYYFETPFGNCGLRQANSYDEARKSILAEVGTYQGVSVVKEATTEEIGWVTAMQGYVP